MYNYELCVCVCTQLTAGKHLVRSVLCSPVRLFR
jgi:hypothetical protein